MNYELLESLKINIFISFYCQSLVANLRIIDGQPVISTGRDARVMGMHFNKLGGWLSSYSGVTKYSVFQAPDYRVYRPIVTYHTGYLDHHELVIVRGSPVFNATRFDCLGTIAEDMAGDFKTVYRPSFATKSEHYDRHHINGIALSDGIIKYVSCFTTQSKSESKSWKHFPSTGVIWDVISNKPIIENLNIPHSPRVIDGKLWLCNSGEGEIKRYNRGKEETLETGTFTRGVRVWRDYVFVGASKVRDTAKHCNREKIADNKVGLHVVDRANFTLLDTLWLGELIEGATEIFDFVILPSDYLVLPPVSEGYKSLNFL